MALVWFLIENNILSQRKIRDLRIRHFKKLYRIYGSWIFFFPQAAVRLKLFIITCFEIVKGDFFR